VRGGKKKKRKPAPASKSVVRSDEEAELEGVSGCESSESEEEDFGLNFSGLQIYEVRWMT
jgi:hypothetical protein